jgi:Protein of unknown function (DUF1761)
MNFAGFNYLSVFVAAVVAFAFGAVYYMTLATPWLAALGKTKAEVMGPSGKPPVVPYIATAIALIVMAWMLAGVMGHLGPGQVTLKNGVISAGFLWFGFVATTMAVNNAYGGRKPMLTVIDSVHWLGVLLIEGAVIGAMGT